MAQRSEATGEGTTDLACADDADLHICSLMNTANPHFSRALIWGCGGVLGELGRPFFDDDIVPWRFWSQRMAWFTLRRGFFGRAPPNDDGIAGGSVVV